MKELIWKSSYELGITDIDDQHRMFLRLVEKIRNESCAGTGDEKLKRLLNELIKYAEYHFCSEENKMYDYDYPDLARHSRIHDDLLAELRNRVFAVKLDITDYITLEKFLLGWFFSHVLTEDTAFAAFVKNV